MQRSLRTAKALPHAEILRLFYFLHSTKRMTTLIHVEKALAGMAETPVKKFITLENTKDIKGIAPKVTFEIQSDPINEVGVNGCQASDMLEYAKCLFQSLNDSFPCRENALTITKLEEAIHWQDHRTRDRVDRGVEGNNKK